MEMQLVTLCVTQRFCDTSDIFFPAQITFSPLGD
ncbi:hypothetical protein PSYMP_04345 [Pseudomonas amygdali pv. morsprunorum str. M302280]|nr:hypothetical protein PSYMP_04345 [Pseudomonas amygdali pv. morsprunorum str. M302280]